MAEMIAAWFLSKKLKQIITVIIFRFLITTNMVPASDFGQANMRFDGNGSITLNNQLEHGTNTIQVDSAKLQLTTKVSVH
jgi:hypothetical protein